MLSGVVAVDDGDADDDDDDIAFFLLTTLACCTSSSSCGVNNPSSVLFNNLPCCDGCLSFRALAGKCLSNMNFCVDTSPESVFPSDCVHLKVSFSELP